MANENARATETGDGRARIWAAIIYPESAPEDWRSLLDQEHIEWAESPLHDMDVNEGTGEVKKPHWHIILAFDGKKSYEQVSELLKPLNGPIPKRCHSLKGAVRYFAHIDNPEKAQYAVSGIVGHGGFDVTAALQPGSAERHQYIAEMQIWCKTHEVVEMEDLMDYAREERRNDWFPLLCDSCMMVMEGFLRSRRHRTAPKKNSEG